MRRNLFVGSMFVTSAASMALMAYLSGTPALIAQTILSVPVSSGSGIKYVLPSSAAGHIFGTNLDFSTNYGNNQLTANLLATTNYSFQTQEFAIISACASGTTTTWTDQYARSPQPANFWQGASFRVVSGADAGATGTITASTAATNSVGQVFTLSPAVSKGCSNASGGDQMQITCAAAACAPVGAANAGLNLAFTGGGSATFETADLSSSSSSPQALQMAAAGSATASTTAYWDASVNGSSYINMNGTYSLAFRAKGTTGSPIISYTVQRAGGSTLLSGTVSPAIDSTPGAGWANYTQTFTPIETGSQTGTGLVVISITGGTVLLQDITLTEGAAGGNSTAFRNAVYQKLLALQPGILRFMTPQQWGCSVANMMQSFSGRQLCGSSLYAATGSQIPYGLNEFLTLAKAIGADPWWTFSPFANASDMANIAAYMSGTCGNGNAYTAYRCNYGQTAPWSSVFNHIYLEFGNEVWNTANGIAIYQPQAYGALLGANDAAFKASSFYTTNMKLVGSGFIYGTGAYGWNNQALHAAGAISNGLPDYIDGAPYLFYDLTDTSSNANIFGPMFAEPVNLTQAGGVTYQLQNTANSAYPSVNAAVYESNLSTNCALTGISQATINNVVAGVGAGLDATLNMLLSARDAGVLVQSEFALPEDQASFNTASSSTAGSCPANSGLHAPLWGMNLTMAGPGSNGIVDRPTGIALQLVNAAMKPNLLNVTQTGTPTYNQAAAQPNPTASTPGTPSIAANSAVPYVQAFGFSDGAGNYSLIVYNVNLTGSESITFSGAAAPTGSVSKTVFTSANITDNNESTHLGGTPTVALPTPTTMSNPAGDTLPAYSMTIYTWDIGSGGTPALNLPPIRDQTYGAGPFPIAATSNSPAAILFSILSGPATIAGNSVTLTGIGTVTVQANQAATGTYTTASALTSFNVTGEAPALNFTPIPNQSYGAAPFPISATSNSTGAISYSVVSGPATVSGSTLTIIGTGTVALIATQASTGDFTTGSAVTTFSIGGASPNLTFAAVPSQTYGTVPFPVSATSTSTGAISYSVVSGPATIVGNTVTLGGAGAVTLQASQVAQGGYLAATTTISYAVTGATPSLTFTAIPSPTYGVSPFTVTATSNSSGAITYSVLSGPATVVGNTVTLSGAGAVTLQVSQAPQGDYLAATASTSFIVTGASPNLSFAAIPSLTYGASPFTVTATSNSSGAITYSILSGPATIASSVVTPTGAGTVTLQANQAAQGNFAAATATATFLVGPTAIVLTGDFSLPASGPPMTLTRGQSGTAAVLVSPVNGFAGTVSFSCSVPSAMSAATCTATAAQLNGSSTGTSTVKVTTVSAAIESQVMMPRGLDTEQIALFCILLPLSLPLPKQKGRSVIKKMLAVVAFALLAGSTGCSSNTVAPVTPVGTYNLSVAGTSGSITHTSSIAVTVR